ncbi:hypothetical protein BC829DRAFT_388872 [Chytridium lagenaria]|nr:hypothetical protein BC829DRAFT_388872 [Chytridium lagenaria]
MYCMATSILAVKLIIVSVAFLVMVSRAVFSASEGLNAVISTPSLPSFSIFCESLNATEGEGWPNEWLSGCGISAMTTWLSLSTCLF